MQFLTDLFNGCYFWSTNVQTETLVDPNDDISKTTNFPTKVVESTLILNDYDSQPINRHKRLDHFRERLTEAKLPQHVIDQLCQIFPSVSHTYNQIIQPHCSFLPYHYVIRQLLILNQYPQYLKHFFLYKSLEKIKHYDHKWQQICQHLGWTFNPTDLNSNQKDNLDDLSSNQKDNLKSTFEQICQRLDNFNQPNLDRTDDLTKKMKYHDEIFQRICQQLGWTQSDDLNHSISNQIN